jgi:hypothetical protein
MKRDAQKALVGAGILICVFLLTGCESLRKKFTRKRKNVETEEPMVIAPRDYSAHPFPSDVLYKQYFVYWKSWNQELVVSLNDLASYKKIVDCVEQSLVNLKKMQSYLNEAKAVEIEVYIKKTEDLKATIERVKNLPPVRMTSLRYDADRILSSVNRLFDLKKMRDHLK